VELLIISCTEGFLGYGPSVIDLTAARSINRVGKEIVYYGQNGKVVDP
jgi:hypothetical protein